MRLLLVLLACVSSLSHAGNEGAGGGGVGIADGLLSLPFTVSDGVVIEVAPQSIDILVDAMNKREMVFSEDLGKNVIPFQLKDEQQKIVIEALTEDSELVEFEEIKL